MKIKNRLKEILEGLGIKSMIPTNSVLSNKLDGMSLIRFNKLLNNSGPNDIQLREVQLLTAWLSEVTGKPKGEIQLLGEEAAS